MIEAFFAQVMKRADAAVLLGREHLSVDGTLIQARASHTSFKPRDGDDDSTPNGPGRNAQADRQRGATPHVAQNEHARRRSAIDGRTTRPDGHRLGHVVRKRIEEHFGRGRTAGRIRQTTYRGNRRVHPHFKLTMTASNLIRMARMLGAARRGRRDPTRGRTRRDAGRHRRDVRRRAAEVVVGEAIAGLGDRPFVVSKVLPSNASAAGTVEAFERLVAQGKIGAWGVSNFDVDGMRALFALPAGARCASNQVYYALSRRGAAFDRCPWMGERVMPTMAYCPLDEGRLVDHPALALVAHEFGATPAQVALACLLAPGPHRTGVIAIPKTASVTRVEENVAAAALRLSAEQLAALDRAFPPPARKVPLAMT